MVCLAGACNGASRRGLARQLRCCKASCVLDGRGTVWQFWRVLAKRGKFSLGAVWQLWQGSLGSCAFSFVSVGHGRNGLVGCVPAWCCKVRRGLARGGSGLARQLWCGLFRYVPSRFGWVRSGKLRHGSCGLTCFVMLRLGRVWQSRRC